MDLDPLTEYKLQLIFYTANLQSANDLLWGHFGPLAFPWISELIRSSSKGQRTVQNKPSG